MYDSTQKSMNIINTNVAFHQRGGVVSLSEKKSYKVNLLDKKGDKEKLAILNMREDNDWILNPLVFDYSYMREKIGYDIWNVISNEYSHDMKYVELIIDNNYLGLYCLQEPVDIKTFNANKKTDLLISIKDYAFNITNRLLFTEDAYNSEDMLDEFEFSAGFSGEERINILREFYNSFTNNEKNNIEYDTDNSINYTLFINMILAVDNSYKNEKILLEYKDNKYVIKKSPWDLDISMCNDKIYTDSFNINMIERDLTLPKYISESEELKKLLKEKYFELRKSIYNEETINEIINNYKNILNSSGAVIRDSEKWGNEHFNDSIEVIKTFFKDRIEVLDRYYGDL